ncbi:unnamed protein product [Soboliphyme baturini]|uniref:60S ribosomal protein L28 n=1 Tax=Soboliphyme baturini TaxID=241478 RepID=A0A183IVZ6_9BILA|nr:unnamed protein product [Soboliphyme baturini]
MGSSLCKRPKIVECRCSAKGHSGASSGCLRRWHRAARFAATIDCCDVHHTRPVIIKRQKPVLGDETMLTQAASVTRIDGLWMAHKPSERLTFAHNSGRKSDPINFGKKTNKVKRMRKPRPAGMREHA